MSKKFFVIVLALLFLGCKDDGITPPTNPLQLTVEDVSCTEAFLKLSLAANEPNRTVTVKRNDSVVTTITLTTVDTLVTDVNLQPKKTYTYTANAGSWKTSVQITTLDTTSHTIHWQTPDTLGVYGLIRDVWVFSKTNAWAVGEIYLADSTGKPDMSNPYNAAQWDGSKWEVKQILVRDFGTGTGYYPLYAIFAFGPNNIWFASDADFIHWDGTQFTSKAFFMTQIPFDGQIRKIWGTNANNLYCVGRTGAIYHYTGSGNWTKQESHTTVDLSDIWGIDNEHVWATGFNNNDGHCVLLQYDGERWKIIYDNTNSTPSTLQYFNTVWTDNVNYLYLDGGSYTQFFNLRNGLFRRTDSLTTYTVSRLRGITRNDIIRVGFGGETVHFNGVSWYLYPELKLLNEGFAGFNSVYPTTDLVLIGGLYLTALNGFPVVIRGYR